jgi:hypothetical protein
MTTKLNKKVVRETTFSFSKSRPLMVALMPGDIIAVWAKGTRTKWELPVEAALSVAVKMHVAAEKARKEAERKAKRRG